MSNPDKKPEAPAPAKAPKEKPEAPAQDPAAGDKTPAYVAWYRDNHSPEEFAAKYGSRKTPEI
jgi:hypothetical protein